MTGFLRRASDRVFVEVMQQVNVAILNVWFLTALLGAPLAMVVAGALALSGGAGRLLPPVTAAVVLYLAMIAVTRVFNIRMNNELAAASADRGVADLAVARRRFERPWNRWNSVRTLLSAASLCCLVWALTLDAGAGSPL